MNTIDEHTLDATLLAPQVRHATIFAQYNALNNGNSFILENNHDPVTIMFFRNINSEISKRKRFLR